MVINQAKEWGKISVIVPVYGEDEYLDSCVESIVNQTYTNLEIILVDDDSPDKCPYICDEWAKRDDRIKVVHKQNGGLVSARQAGMEVATGQYIGYVDGDDWIEPDMYENMIDVMYRENVDIVIDGFKKDLFGKCVSCFNPIEEGVYRGEQLVNEIFPKMICEGKSLRCGLYTYVWNKLFKIEKVYQHQMNVDQRIIVGEDSACVYPTILDADSIAITSQSGYHYRQRMDSLLRKKKRNHDSVNRLRIFYKYMCKYLESSEYKDILEKQLYYFYLNHLIMMSDILVEIYPEIGDNFPFFNVKENCSLIIYGAGAYGIHIYRQFCDNNKYELVAWADSDYEQYDKCEYQVISLESALKKPFDYVVIASVDEKYIKESEDILKQFKVEKNKILSIKDNMDIAIHRMKEIGIA